MFNNCTSILLRRIVILGTISTLVDDPREELLKDNADIVECGDEDSEDKLDDLDVPDDVCPADEDDEEEEVVVPVADLCQLNFLKSLGVKLYRFIN